MRRPAVRARLAIPAALFATAAATLCAPRAAQAQAFMTGFAAQRMEPGRRDASFDAKRLSVFVLVNSGYADYDATFDVRDASQLNGTQTDLLDVRYEASTMRTDALMPMFGATYAASDRLVLSAALGSSWLTLEDRRSTIPGSWYENQHDALFAYELRPGFAANLGGWYLPYVSDLFSVSLGLRLSLATASRLQSDVVDGSIEEGGAVRTFREARTNDASLALWSATAHAGGDWRPFGSFLSNGFGLLLSLQGGFGSLERTLSVSRTIGADTQSSSTDLTVDLSMLGSRYVGLYYGWSLFVPSFGVLGLEARLLNNWQVVGTYEYLF